MSHIDSPHTHSRPPSRLSSGHLLILATACLWSFGGLFVKLITGHYHVDPRALACLRSAIGGLILSWALPQMKPASRWKLIGAGVSYTLVVGGFVLSTSGTSAANAILLQYAYPLFVAIGAFFLFSEAIGRRTIIALALGMTGIAIILVCSWSAAERQGLIYGVGSSFAFAAFTLFSRSMRQGNPFALSSFYNLMAAALLFLPAYGCLRISWSALLVVAVMGTFQLALPYVLFIKGLRTVPATDAALITLVEPILNPVWVWLLIGESPNPSTLIGGALIILALLARFLGIRPAPLPQRSTAKNDGSDRRA